MPHNCTHLRGKRRGRLGQLGLDLQPPSGRSSCRERGEHHKMERSQAREEKELEKRKIIGKSSAQFMGHKKKEAYCARGKRRRLKEYM